MYVCPNAAGVQTRLCVCVCRAGREGADRTGARQPKSVIAEVNIRCNQQMTTQKMEGAEMEGLGRCGRALDGGMEGGGKGVLT